MNLLIVAAEAAPLVKIGGLGDYVGSLPKALLKEMKDSDAKHCIDVRIAIPYTHLIDPYYLKTKKSYSLVSKKAGIENSFRIYEISINKVRYYVFKNTSMEDGNETVYTTDPIRDGEKFITFSYACLDFFSESGWTPDIIQCNDWQTGVICNALKRSRRRQSKNTRSVFVVHNLPFMGTGTEEIMHKYNVPAVEDKSAPDWGKYLPIMSGLSYADHIVTVSPRYAKEIRTPAFGNDLQDYLATRKNSITGILNGIDLDYWNPQTDTFITQNFSEKELNKRNKNKQELCQITNLEYKKNTPLLIMVTRLDRQKGIDLLIETLRTMAGGDWQTIILGTGNEDLEIKTKDLENSLRDQVRAINRFDNAFSHQMFAGGDIFLMPSLYEPCGTSQMISMRYGCIPVAHAVGGLVDSIKIKDSNRTGYLFLEPTVNAFLQALEEALKDFHNNTGWSTIQKRAMQQDFSWRSSAKKYIKIYKDLMRKV